MHGFRIGSIRGIPVRVHWTFLLALPLVAALFGRHLVRDLEIREEDVAQALILLWGLVAAIGIFASVLAHEAAHSLYALRKGGEIRDILLLPFGGVSRMDRAPTRPWDEGVMALLGPLTSAAIGVVLLVSSSLIAGLLPFPIVWALRFLGSANLFLAIFNLLPAFPMDGGRVLRSLLTPKLGAVRATSIAASVGKTFAVFFGIAGLAFGNLLLVAIAFFVFMGAEGERRQALVDSVIGELRVSDLVSPPIEPIDAREPVAVLARRLVRDRLLALPVTDHGTPIGVAGVNEIERVPLARRQEVAVRDVLLPILVTPEEPVSGAIGTMERADVALLPVVTDGRLVGTLRRREVIRWLRLRPISSPA